MIAMRTFCHLIAVAVLAGCGANDVPHNGSDGSAPEVSEQRAEEHPWTGYYEGTLPCADCPGIRAQLWVRSDSSFVLRRQYPERDTLAFGTMGYWTLAQGQLELYDRMQVIGRLRSTATGVEWLGEEGLPNGPEGSQVLARVADAPADEVPRMRLKGAFTYYADAMSFRPCGMERSWPSAGAREWTAEGEALGSMGTVELQGRYLKAVKQGGAPWILEVECSLATGPAMEGDGQDEYLFIHRVRGILEPGACP
jgi:uncharacterized lipoprotein NlpE involved in copper resistance